MGHSDRWTPERKMACLKALEEGSTYRQVCIAYGVPESTLRRWSKARIAMERGEEGDGGTQELARKAVLGAKINVDYLLKRLQSASESEQELEKIRMELRVLGPRRKGEPEEKTQRRKELQEQAQNYHEMSDAAATSILRALLTVSVKTGEGAGAGLGYEEMLKEVLGEEF